MLVVVVRVFEYTEELILNVYFVVCNCLERAIYLGTETEITVFLVSVWGG